MGISPLDFLSMVRRVDANRKQKLNPPPSNESIHNPNHPRQAPKLESDSGHAPLEAKEVQRPVGQRVLVSIKSYRKRLIDPDNLCTKYHIDLCRYASALSDDTAAHVELKVTQEKVSETEQERTEITISPL